ncbi:MAG: hypothetical protein LAT63_07460 [Marinobacter sp.]|nr:hypothetical protein [Marinobacter sp.]
MEDNMTYFLEIFGAVPRAGPGSSASTRRAYELIPDVPDAPRILDIGCGPGVICCSYPAARWWRWTFCP